MKKSHSKWLFFCLQNKMKILFINFFLLLLTSCAPAQNQKNMQIIKEFTFSTARFYKEIQIEAAKTSQIRNVKIILPTPNGEEEFTLLESNVGEKRVPGFYTFRGSSADGQRTISLSLRRDSMNAIMLYNSQTFYIEEVENSKDKYLLYLPKPIQNQENDFVK